MKKKKFPQLSLEELKNVGVSIDYEKPGVRVIGGDAEGWCCANGYANEGFEGCLYGDGNTGYGGCINGNSNGGAPADNIIQ